MSTMAHLAEKIRREAIRWHLLQAAETARPLGISADALLSLIRGVYPDATENEIRRALDYLEERELVKLDKDPLDMWTVELTRIGMDLVDYTIDCQPGIARPLMIKG